MSKVPLDQQEILASPAVKVLLDSPVIKDSQETLEQLAAQDNLDNLVRKVLLGQQALQDCLVVLERLDQLDQQEPVGQKVQ